MLSTLSHKKNQRTLAPLFWLTSVIITLSRNLCVYHLLANRVKGNVKKKARTTKNYYYNTLLFYLLPLSLSLQKLNFA